MTAEESARTHFNLKEGFDIKEEEYYNPMGVNAYYSFIGGFNKGKQDAEMGFAEWASRFQWVYSHIEKKWWHKENNTHNRVDSEYLYQIYLNWLEENGK